MTSVLNEKNFFSVLCGSTIIKQEPTNEPMKDDSAAELQEGEQSSSSHNGSGQQNIFQFTPKQLAKPGNFAVSLSRGLRYENPKTSKSSKGSGSAPSRKDCSSSSTAQKKRKRPAMPGEYPYYNKVLCVRPEKIDDETREAVRSCKNHSVVQLQTTSDGCSHGGEHIAAETHTQTMYRDVQIVKKRDGGKIESVNSNVTYTLPGFLKHQIPADFTLRAMTVGSGFGKTQLVFQHCQNMKHPELCILIVTNLLLQTGLSDIFTKQLLFFHNLDIPPPTPVERHGLDFSWEPPKLLVTVFKCQKYLLDMYIQIFVVFLIYYLNITQYLMNLHLSLYFSLILDTQFTMMTMAWLAVCVNSMNQGNLSRPVVISIPNKTCSTGRELSIDYQLARDWKKLVDEITQTTGLPPTRSQARDLLEKARQSITPGCPRKNLSLQTIGSSAKHYKIELRQRFCTTAKRFEQKEESQLSGDLEKDVNDFLLINTTSRREEEEKKKRKRQSTRGQIDCQQRVMNYGDYQRELGETTAIPIGDICVGMKCDVKSDGNFYRSSVMAISGKHVTVRYHGFSGRPDEFETLPLAADVFFEYETMDPFSLLQMEVDWNDGVAKEFIEKENSEAAKPINQKRIVELAKRIRKQRNKCPKVGGAMSPMYFKALELSRTMS